jgi:hypothetical protein
MELDCFVYFLCGREKMVLSQVLSEGICSEYIAFCASRRDSIMYSSDTWSLQSIHVLKYLQVIVLLIKDNCNFHVSF